jgi:hypothetical protein
LQGAIKKIEEIPFKKIAEDTLNFIDHLKINQVGYKLPKKYLGELAILGGQIIDISRGLLLLQDNKN